MIEVIFLLVLGLIWIIFASVQDLRMREVANWLNFSLIIFALGFRFFYSLFNNNFAFFYQGLIGLGIFFVLGNLLYYGRMFAGGDAKLMIALGTILPLTNNFKTNLEIFVLFFMLFLFVGAFYGVVWSVYLSLKNSKKFKKEFNKRVMDNKLFVYVFAILGFVLIALGFIEPLFSFIGLLILVIPYFYLFAKSVDESCMVKKISSRKLTEGDWLYKNVKVGKKIIAKSWEGLSKKDIELIKKKHKFVLVREGVAFVPVFLISFLLLIYFWFVGFSFY